MCYPDYLIRGIPNRDFLDEDGLPSAKLFHFNKPESVRLPGYREESINWYDDEEAINHTFNQRKDDDSLQFKTGIAILARSELDKVKNNPNVRERFNYERYRLPTNQYHGNILLKTDAPKPLIRKIAAQLALNVDRIITREEYEIIVPVERTS
jgi:hypothetical protein